MIEKSEEDTEKAELPAIQEEHSKAEKEHGIIKAKSEDLERELIDISFEGICHLRIISSSCTMLELIEYSKILKGIFFNNDIHKKEKNYYG